MSQIFNLRRVTVAAAAIFAVMSCVLFSGCSTVTTAATPRDLIRFKKYQPENVYADHSELPKSVRRVVVLPLVCDGNDVNLDQGRAELEPVLASELIKTKKFEVVTADSKFLKNRTTRADWTGEEALPPEFFSLLRESSGCDAVLFSRLTTFRSYPPLAVGWRFRLVDIQTGKTIWSADEIFDGGEPTVENGARHHQLTEERSPGGAPDLWFIQNSPAKFGEYTAARLFATLPAR